MNISDIVRAINDEDKTVAFAVERALPQVEILAEKIVSIFRGEGRLFYIGAGTSGRLGIVDASECVPTFGTPPGMIVGVIAGGDGAIRTAVEGAEDDIKQGFKDLQACNINRTDIVVGIAASGRTPYVVHAMKECQQEGIATGCIVCSPGSELAKYSDYPVEVFCGPEFITGSTRMKAGTAQKMVLNMLSTAAMIKLGRVSGNTMNHMAVTNSKLKDRAIRIIVKKRLMSDAEASALLEQYNGDLARLLRDFESGIL